MSKMRNKRTAVISVSNVLRTVLVLAIGISVIIFKPQLGKLYSEVILSALWSNAIVIQWLWPKYKGWPLVLLVALSNLAFVFLFISDDTTGSPSVGLVWIWIFFALATPLVIAHHKKTKPTEPSQNETLNAYNLSDFD